MIYLATGVTPNYLERATPFLESLRKFTVNGVTEDETKVHHLVFCVDFRIDDRQAISNLPVGVDCKVIDYGKVPIQLPKKMLQNGNFVPFAPPYWKEGDIIIFTDADAVLQREFTTEEITLINAIGSLEIMVGYNRPNEPEDLWQEAECLAPKLPLPEIARRFPEMAGMRCGNFGFVAARLGAWRELLHKTIRLEDDCRACFDNPARVQWMACYAAQTSILHMTDLPPSMHAHGHLGIKTGLSRDPDGIWRQDLEVVLFAHAL